MTCMFHQHERDNSCEWWEHRSGGTALGLVPSMFWLDIFHLKHKTGGQVKLFSLAPVFSRFFFHLTGALGM